MGFKVARLVVAVVVVALIAGLYMLSQWIQFAGVAGVGQAHGEGWAWVTALLGGLGVDVPLIYGNYRYATDVWQWSCPAALLYAAPGLLLAVPLLILGVALLLWRRLRGNGRA